MLIRRGFRYRLYPTPQQQGRLLAWEGALRALWNAAHEQRRLCLARGGRMPTAFDQMNQLTAMRAEVPWLADVPRNVCAQILVDLDAAWQRSFKQLSRRPRWKKKGRLPEARRSVRRAAPATGGHAETLHHPSRGGSVVRGNPVRRDDL